MGAKQRRRRLIILNYNCPDIELLYAACEITYTPHLVYDEKHWRDGHGFLYSRTLELNAINDGIRCVNFNFQDGVKWALYQGKREVFIDTVPTRTVCGVQHLLNVNINTFRTDNYGALSIIFQAYSGPRFSSGYGAGEGEEYCDIPGCTYDDIGIPDWFLHPKTGELFLGVRWLGCECDDGMEYVVIPTKFSKLLTN
jgi:hypothetical protein